MFDPSWNPADDRQAVDRAYRIGQARDVVVYRLIAAGIFILVYILQSALRVRVIFFFFTIIIVNIIISIIFYYNMQVICITFFFAGAEGGGYHRNPMIMSVPCI